MKCYTLFLIATLSLFTKFSMARECHLPKEWQNLCSILQSRVSQTIHKMKLQESEATSLENYLHSLRHYFVYLPKLQYTMPKTTTELLIATRSRGLNKNEADKMAGYLIRQLQYYKFQNPSAFDNNTSHIIGREWYEIDYSGEHMTWQKQKKYYAPYGISNFKSVDCLKKFFTVESKLPYFNKIYKPRN